MKSVAFHTLGCKVNQYETEAIMELFLNADYKIVDFVDYSDIYVINTCTVTNMAAKKSRQMISRARKKNKDAVIVVIGCYAQNQPEEVSKISGVNLVIGTDKRADIVKLVEQYLKNKKQINVVHNIKKVKDFESLNIERNHGKTRAYIKIQEGCNQFCSYCIIPYTRGSIRSRRPEDIVSEISKLVKNGYKEVVLTGIHVASYGKDLKNITLLDIIRLIHEIEGLERIRLSSLEPTMITETFVQNIQGLTKLCCHYHLSLQSGSNKTLKEMNRKYTNKQYMKSVELLRKYIPDVAITTDVIVGFPGETNKDFEKSYNFVKKVGFSEIHVFKYSPREGTPAAERKNQVDGNVKEIRSHKMIELGKTLQEDYLRKFIGKIKLVLFEKYDVNEQVCEGYTDNYIKVHIKSKSDLKNQIIAIKIKEIKVAQDGALVSIGEKI